MRQKIPNPYSTIYKATVLEVEAFPASEHRFTALCNGNPSSVCQTAIGAMHEALENARSQIDREPGVGIERQPIQPEVFLAPHYFENQRRTDARLIKHGSDKFEVFVWFQFQDTTYCAYRSSKTFETRKEAEKVLLLSESTLQECGVQSDWIPITLEDRIGQRID